MTALAELPSVGQVTGLAEWQARESYGRALIALSRRASVPGAKLSHLAVRVLMFLLGQRPGYFAHQKKIAEAVNSNLTSVRRALFKLRDAGLLTWHLIPPHHLLPTGKYTRTNVNRYFVEEEALLRALGEGVASAPPRKVASTRPDPDASTGTDLRSEQDPPYPSLKAMGRRPRRRFGFPNSGKRDLRSGHRAPRRACLARTGDTRRKRLRSWRKSWRRGALWTSASPTIGRCECSGIGKRKARPSNNSCRPSKERSTTSGCGRAAPGHRSRWSSHHSQASLASSPPAESTRSNVKPQPNG